ncbi:hypothetical protein [Trueperella sp. LYQ143]|uniref:hypothetical protein n=1 Tax=Trueperella sp. LYQ143 TaxID=3391059 RepID=UPI0039832641
MSSADYFVVRRGAVVLPNEIVHNDKLSYTALGVLAVCLALKPGTKLGYRNLADTHGLGERGVRSALLELESLNLRFRFLVRDREGKLRELTIISDYPLSPSEAFNEVQLRIANRAYIPVTVLRCTSHPEFDVNSIQVGDLNQRDEQLEQSRPDSMRMLKMSSSRSTRSTAQRKPHASTQSSSLGESENESSRSSESVEHISPAENSKTAGHTVRRSTVARSDAAQISKDISKPKLLRNFGLPNHPPGAGEKLARDSADGVPGVDGSVLFSEKIWALLTASGRARIERIASEAVGRGWTVEMIQKRLSANPLPALDQVQNLDGLVIYRLEQIARDVPPRTLRTVSPAERRSEIHAQLKNEINRILDRVNANLTSPLPHRNMLLVSAEGKIEQLPVAERSALRQRVARARERISHEAAGEFAKLLNTVIQPAASATIAGMHKRIQQAEELRPMIDPVEQNTLKVLSERAENAVTTRKSQVERAAFEILRVRGCKEDLPENLHPDVAQRCMTVRARYRLEPDKELSDFFTFPAESLQVRSADESDVKRGSVAFSSSDNHTCARQALSSPRPVIDKSRSL